MEPVHLWDGMSPRHAQRRPSDLRHPRELLVRWPGGRLVRRLRPPARPSRRGTFDRVVGDRRGVDPNPAPARAAMQRAAAAWMPARRGALTSSASASTTSTWENEISVPEPTSNPASNAGVKSSRTVVGSTCATSARTSVSKRRPMTAASDNRRCADRSRCDTRRRTTNWIAGGMARAARAIVSSPSRPSVASNSVSSFTNNGLPPVRSCTRPATPGATSSLRRAIHSPTSVAVRPSRRSCTLPATRLSSASVSTSALGGRRPTGEL